MKHDGCSGVEDDDDAADDDYDDDVVEQKWNKFLFFASSSSLFVVLSFHQFTLLRDDDEDNKCNDLVGVCQRTMKEINANEKQKILRKISEKNTDRIYKCNL